MAYWSFSDVFEEQGVVKTPFYGGFGLVAEDGIPKPALNAFAMLHQLGNRRIKVDSDSALATRSSDGAHRHRALELRSTLRHRRNLHSASRKHRSIKNIHRKTHRRHPPMRRCKLWRLDADHGNVIKTYDAMGRPAFPNSRSDHPAPRGRQTFPSAEPYT